MGKIVKLEDINEKIKKLRNEHASIVLVGGCFDILHIGHIDFLEKAKALGDKLFVVLESDEALKKLKGSNRPIHLQKDRARILSSLEFVDIVVLLPFLNSNKSYDEVILSIKPAIIATTIGDPNRAHKERQAKILGAEVVDIPKVKNISTTRIAEMLGKEF